ncbi:hypothetical protein J1614_010666 [Plenodomus biglobosus]|nr:hypothetical protein J1614_010666 [Plenodomus biglobosus]
MMRLGIDTDTTMENFVYMGLETVLLLLQKIISYAIDALYQIQIVSSCLNTAMQLSWMRLVFAIACLFTVAAANPTPNAFCAYNPFIDGQHPSH